MREKRGVYILYENKKGRKYTLQCRVTINSNQYSNHKTKNLDNLQLWLAR